MARACTVARGMTLVELVTALLVASLVAAIVLVSLSIDGRTHGRAMSRRRREDDAWLALAAIAGDIGRGGPAVWKVTDGTLRRDGQPYVDGVQAFVLRPDGQGADASRVPGDPRVVALHLVLDDGRRFVRVVEQP
ncbi:prepilin-type N-terminal cleavage/methylation domain-containing protein [Luteibacter sp. PPL552]